MKLKKLFAGFVAAAITAAALTVSAYAVDDIAANVKHFTTAPTIDGAITEAEWGTPAIHVAKGAPNINVRKFINMESVDEVPDFTADVYLGWDETHVYIAAVAQYDYHSNPALIGVDIWQGTCLQVQLGGVSEPESGINGRNELGFAQASSPKRQMTYAWASAAKAGVKYNDVMKAGENFLVERNEDTKTTVYEIAIPLEAFSKQIEKLEVGTKLPFSFAFINAYNGDKGYDNGGYYEFYDGIVENKDITLAPFIVMSADTLGGGAAVAPEPTPEPAPAEETPTEEVPAEETFAIHVVVPAEWGVPNAWAWGSKGDVFSAWPGGAMTPDGDVYTIDLPTWIDGFLIDGSGGSVQTADIKGFDVTKDVWVVIKADKSFEMTQDGEAAFAALVAAAQATPEPTPEPTQAPTPEPTAEPTPEPTPEPTQAPTQATSTPAPATDAPVSSSDGGSNAGIIIGVIAAVVVIGGGCAAFFILKGKKKQ